MADDSGGLVFALEAVAYAVPAIIGFVSNKEKAAKKESDINKFKNILSSTENTSTGAVLDPRTSLNSVSFSNEFFALSMNNDNKQILIATDKQNVYGFDNIVNVEIAVDGNSVASPSLGGAIVGGVLFGGAGAIVGSSNKTINKKIQNISLKVFVDDLKNPFHKLDFYSGIAVDPSSPVIVSTLKEINEWYSRFLNIIEKKKTLSASTNSNGGNGSVADEIAKLSSLLKDGVISQDEFDAAKKKLLGL